MRKIISNTSCLISLTNINMLHVLRECYTNVYITKEVAQEYGDPIPEWITVQAVSDSKATKILNAIVDLGEASTMALALESNNSTMILDDMKARKLASSLCFAWAKGAIQYLHDKKIVSGIDDNKFEPNRSVTRAEFVKMLTLALNTPMVGDCDFIDVQRTDWFYPYIAASANGNMVNGIGNNLFAPHESITREDIATIIYRALGDKVVIREIRPALADNQNFSDYAKTGVIALYNAFLINGYDDGTFRAKNFASRAETAKILYNLIESGVVQ